MRPRSAQGPNAPAPSTPSGVRGRSRPARTAGVLLLLCLLLVAPTAPACTADGSSGGHDTFVVWDSAGTEIVESRGAGAADTGLRIAAEPEVRIGAVTSGNPAEELTRVNALRRLSDGRVVVAEGMTQEIRWFDPAGRPLVTRGGTGQGPSEFNFAGELLRLPGDTIVVVDRPRIKHVFFGPDAAFVRAEVLDQARLAATGPRAECPVMTLPDRSLVLCRPEEGRTMSAAPGYYRSFARFVRLPWTLDTEDRLGLYGGIEQWGIEMDGRVSFQVHPFHSWTAATAGGDPPRLAIARNPGYEIEIWTPDGRLERIVRRPGAERRPDRDDHAWAEQRFAGRVADDQVLARFRAEMPVPDTIPPIRRLVIAGEGDIWVLRDERSAPEGSWLYDVFDPEGRFLGAARLPEGFLLHEAGPDYLLGVRSDAQDVPFVELYRIERGGAAADGDRGRASGP